PEPAPEPIAPEPPPAEGFTTTFSTGAVTPEPIAAPLAEAPTPAASVASAPVRPLAPEPPGASGPGGPPLTEVVAPPAPDPSLLAPPEDPFGGKDPADGLFAQGYLADSKGGEVVGTIPSVPPMPAGAAPSAPALPAFAPLGGGLAPDPGVAFRSALDAAFASRASGIPFVVVALRMDPAAPGAAHFGAIESGVRASLRPSDKILVDAPRKRAAVVMPSSGPEAAQALFGGLQEHLRSALGPDADRVLQSVAAVTVPDGQPFQTSAELLAYAFEG
ncbi:hypothetical protein BSZ37_19615, partial [Rubrivirga marina]